MFRSFCLASPEILVADEPTSNLDDQSEGEIMAPFDKTHSLRGVTVVMVAHARCLTTWGARTIEMGEGRIVRQSQY